MRLLACVFYGIRFNCKMPMQVLFQIKKSSPKQMSGGFLGTQAFTILEHPVL